MNTPEANPTGYVTASISNVTGFHNINFLLAHGTGDDNVHFANSAHLLDMFTRDKVRNYRFRMFTDRCVGGAEHGLMFSECHFAVIMASTSVVRTESCMNTWSTS